MDTAVVEIAQGLWCVRFPMHGRTDPVNAYVAVGVNGLTVVDAGLGSDIRERWTAALAEIGRDDVGQIVITHFHPDHLGGAAALQQMTGAPVRASLISCRQIDRVWGPGRAEMFARIDRHLVRNGMEAAHVDTLHREQELVERLVPRPKVLQPLGRVSLEFAGARWQPVHTPGHADGHICLWDRAGSRMLVGDHVLQRISPAVGLYPLGLRDPLGHYLASLRKVAELDVREAMPGHGRPFSDLAARCAELALHHDERLEQCRKALRSGAQTAQQVATVVFGEQSQVAQERFAVTEALAHLEYDRLRDRCARSLSGGIWRYRLL